MPKFKVVDIWNDFHILDYVCITTNSIIKVNGNLCMGAGVALEASDREPLLKSEWAKQIKAKNAVGGIYGLLSYGKYIAFQTKTDYRKPSTVEIISHSVEKLKRLAEKYPDKHFGLPYPGINHGKLTKQIVQPLLESLPDNVTVYSKF